MCRSDPSGRVLLSRARSGCQGRVIKNCMYCVEPQTIEVVFLQPIERIMNEVITNGATIQAVKVDGLSPRSVVAIGKELWCIEREVVSFRPKVVVHNIE